MIANDELVEYQEVYEGRYYGTPKSEVERITGMGKNVVLDLDVLGGVNVKKMYGDREDWIAVNGGDYAAYEQACPDWNKVVLIPVSAKIDSRSSALSYSLDITMHQVKLIGGDTPIKIKTIRSKF